MSALQVMLRVTAILAFVLVALGFRNTTEAASIAGVDFSNAANAFDITPDDLNAADGISVSGWTFAGGGGLSADGNSNTGRASAPVGKFNGQDGAAQPLVGAAAPANNVHSFSITIPTGVTFTLSDVTFDYSEATGADSGRWLAFKTSLDPNLIFSESGPARPTFDAQSIALVGPQYQNLTNQTIFFQWYAGGPGTGDIDIDSIVINGFEQQAVPEPASIAIWSLIGVGLIGFWYRRILRKP